MFVQIIEGHAADAAEMQRLTERWDRELRPGAAGFLGSTGGVTSEGMAIEIVRFESLEAAQANAARPEQGAWWAEMEACFDGDITFTDSEDVEEFLGGGSNSAGFVQVMKVTGLDRAIMAELDDVLASTAPEARPELIGGLRIWTGPESGYNVIYFTSHEAARAGEAADAMAEAAPQVTEHLAALRSNTQFLDLTDPWTS